MKKFITNTIIFFVPFLLIIFFGLILPTTPRASKSLIMSGIKKDSLLKKSPSPRIIFVGGSSLSFGLNSKTIKDSLHINPINTAIHAAIGLKYITDNTLQYIKKGDVIVLVPEYFHYYTNVNFGSEELFRTIFDLKKYNISLMNISQILNLVSFIPKYSLTKYKIYEYTNFVESLIYSVHSFNEFGDVNAHWNLTQKEFSSYDKFDSHFIYESVELIKKFNLSIKDKGAILFISYPPYEEASFNNALAQIQKVERELRKTGLTILGTPERYKLPHSMFFNTGSHLLKSGVDHRTQLLLEDFNKALKHN
jgi:hypothetical protein